MPREPEQYRRVLEDQLEELERLSRLAERLLFLCREDAGLVPMSRELVRLDAVVDGCCRAHAGRSRGEWREARG